MEIKEVVKDNIEIVEKNINSEIVKKVEKIQWKKYRQWKQNIYSGKRKQIVKKIDILQEMDTEKKQGK